MQQAQQMQAKLAKAQEEIALMQFEGSSGGGAVHAVTSGNGDLRNLRISPEVIKDADPEMLADLIISAVNSALESGRKHSQQKLGSLTGGLGLPGF